MYPIDVSTACELAGIERQRFNEIVSSGEYPAPPPTSAGKRRMFEEADVIALFAFARLVRFGARVAAAGAWASHLRIMLRATGCEEAELAFQIGMEGAVALGRAPPSEPTFVVLNFPVANIRTLIRAKLAG